jgi:hypothetical protein
LPAEDQLMPENLTMGDLTLQCDGLRETQDMLFHAASAISLLSF